MTVLSSPPPALLDRPRGDRGDRCSVAARRRPRVGDASRSRPASCCVDDDLLAAAAADRRRSTSPAADRAAVDRPTALGLVAPARPVRVPSGGPLPPGLEARTASAERSRRSETRADPWTRRRSLRRSPTVRVDRPALRRSRALPSTCAPPACSSNPLPAPRRLVSRPIGVRPRPSLAVPIDAVARPTPRRLRPTVSDRGFSPAGLDARPGVGSRYSCPPTATGPAEPVCARIRPSVTSRR